MSPTSHLFVALPITTTSAIHPLRISCSTQHVGIEVSVAFKLEVVICFKMVDGANSHLIAPSHAGETEIGDVAFIRDFPMFCESEEKPE